MERRSSLTAHPRTPRKRTNSMIVRLYCGEGGLGIAVAYADALCLPHARSRLPLLVTALSPGGAAQLSGKIAVGDAIASINQLPVDWPRMPGADPLSPSLAASSGERARSNSDDGMASAGSAATGVRAEPQQVGLPPTAMPLTLGGVSGLGRVA